MLTNDLNLIACVDDENWHNGFWHDCAKYAEEWCENGNAKPGQEWTLGEKYNFPERHCCICGKGKSK